MDRLSENNEFLNKFGNDKSTQFRSDMASAILSHATETAREICPALGKRSFREKLEKLVASRERTKSLPCSTRRDQRVERKKRTRLQRRMQCSQRKRAARKPMPLQLPLVLSLPLRVRRARPSCVSADDGTHFGASIKDRRPLEFKLQ